MSVQLELDTQILSSTASSIDILLESEILSGSSSVELVLEPSVVTVEVNLGNGAYADLTGLPTLPSSTIVGTSDTQTLTNKTVTDASFAIQDDLDNTKKAVFQCASLVTGTTYTYNFPPTNGNLIIDTGTQGITGIKTFSAATQNLGSSVAASTCNIAYGANTTGVTKTVNIGTAGLSGSTTNINVGSAVSGALGQILMQAPNIFALGTLTYRGTLAMQSTSIAGNPVIWSVQDQSGAVVTEYGRSDGVASAAIWDFHTGATAIDYDSRIQASGGNGTVGNGSLNFYAANTIFNGPIQLKNYTVGTLPTAGTAGRRAYVTDAIAPTWLGTLTGGGAVRCPVFDNGTAWVAG